MPLSEHLRKIRERKGWTQNHLADVSGVPQPSIWRLEKGLILNPKTSLLRKLAEALEVSMDYLITEDETPSFDEILRHDEVGQAVFFGKTPGFRNLTLGLFAVTHRDKGVVFFTQETAG